MAARSIANGAYLTLMYVQSARNERDWYRVALDRRTRALSCDCPTWTFNRTQNRTCKHAQFVSSLLEHERPHQTQEVASTTAVGAVPQTDDTHDDTHPYVLAVAEQFPGFRGHWRVLEHVGHIGHNGYRIVQMHFTSGNGVIIEATLAFAEAHQLTEGGRRGEVAMRAGYCIALELAHRRGIALDVRPPSHYQSTGTTGTTARRRPQTSADGTAPLALRMGRALPSIAMDQLLRVAGAPAAGNTPTERAEGTLRLMLGDTVYSQLALSGYLDVSSVQYGDRKRVYRLRRDPARNSDKRVRVFEEVGGWMTYVQDLCIVRQSASVPEADHFLSKWLGFLSDEQSILEVVRPHNRFPPHSDDFSTRIDEETLPMWHAPVAALAA